MARVVASMDTKWIEGIEYRKEIKEKADCVVRSLAVALRMSYSSAHAWAKDHGRPNRQGTPWFIITRLLNDLDDSISSVPSRKYYKSTGKLRKMRLSTFAKEYPRGRYIISVSGHMLALVDGTYVETDGTERQNQIINLKDQYVKSAWEVKK